MANTIDIAFIKQFESEVHLAYQRMGSKLRNTVRTVGSVRGNTVRFQKLGKGSANTKSRNGIVTPMELTHSTVEATMADHYAPEYIDKLDELKTNINERQAVAMSAAGALGRRLFIKVLDIMQSGDCLPTIQPSKSIAEAILEISAKRMGMTCVVDTNFEALGILTDGDLRRIIGKGIDIQKTVVEKAMSKEAYSIEQHSLASEAALKMENLKINHLLVLDEKKKLVGAIGIHDLLEAKIL